MQIRIFKNHRKFCETQERQHELHVNEKTNLKPLKATIGESIVERVRQFNGQGRLKIHSCE